MGRKEPGSDSGLQVKSNQNPCATTADGAASLLPTAGYGGEDRINGLHNDLLHHTITHLPFTDAARTAVLASRWRHLWRSTPLVIFDDADLPEPARAAAAAVAQFLADQPDPFRVVRLRHCGFASLDRTLPEWPRLLAAKGTQELALFNKAKPYPSRLPADILRCASLQCLSLAFWRFPVELTGDDIILPHLRMLGLINIDIGEQNLDSLLAFCPVLHTLTLARTKQKRVRLRSQSLRCVILGMSRLEVVAVVDAPLLESVILLEQPAGGCDDARINITCAPNLRVLGYLDPRVHRLQIGDNVIESDTMESPSYVVPGLKILALRVNFRLYWEVKMLANFLRCFPNIETLHIESALQLSAIRYGHTREQHSELWQEASALKCFRSHLKSMVFHNFRGHQNEFEFLKFIARDAHEMESLLLVPLEENMVSAVEVNEMIDKLGCPKFRAWASKVVLVSPKVDIARNLKKASDLTIDDPFCY